MRVLSLAVAALAAANVGAAADDKAADTLGSLVPDPFPSLREVGDTIYTTLSPFITDGAAGSGGKLANASRAVKGVINKKTHVASNAKHDILSTLGPKAYDAWLALSAKDFAAWNATGGTTTCDPSKRPKNTAATYSFAFQGSGLLLPFYQGVVQGLQLRGVLDGETMATAKFSGQSGGAITSALTAVGYTGYEQLGLLGTILVRLAACNVNPPPGGCFINAVGAPIISAAILAKDPDAAKNLSGRLSVWACEVDVTKASNTYSVSQGTNTVGATGWCCAGVCVCVLASVRGGAPLSIPTQPCPPFKKQFTSIADLEQAIRASSTVPCFTEGDAYTVFRGSPYIDGGCVPCFFLYLVRCASINHPVARQCISSTRKESLAKCAHTPFSPILTANRYCNDYAQLCPKDDTKCVKVSSAFLGPNLRGTPYPTTDNCPVVVPSDWLPNPAKPYLVPKDNGTWVPRPFTCDGAAGPEDVPFTRQGVTAKPDIYPFFYQSLDPAFANGCEWLSSSRGPNPANAQAQILAEFMTGVAEAIGWADAQGYCA